MSRSLQAYPRIQVAGVRDEAELSLLIEAGVDDIGFPVGPAVVTPDLPAAEAHRLAKTLSGVGAVAIVYLNTLETVAAFHSEFPAFNKYQLHGELALEEGRKLREAFPNLYLIKSLVVGATSIEDLFEECRAWENLANAFITDTFHPVSKHRGATGLTHDWSISRKLVETCRKPILIAGGLKPDNVRAAISSTKPAGVDVHTGVEGADGRKDKNLLSRFVAESRRALNISRNPNLGSYL